MNKKSMSAFKKYLCFIFLIFLMSYSLLYTTYKRYDITKFPQDSDRYMLMVKDSDAILTYGYNTRVGIVALVKLASYLPFYQTDINANLTLEDKKIYWAFCVVNYVLVCLTASLLFYCFHFCYKKNELLSFLGAMFYLLSYTTLQSNLIPYADALAHLFIIIGLIFIQKKWLWRYSLLLIPGIFVKEIISITFTIYFLIEYLIKRQKHILLWLISPILCFCVYLLVSTKQPTIDAYGILSVNLYAHRVFSFFTYMQGKWLQTIGGYFPLLICFSAYCYLTIFKKRHDIRNTHLLILYPAYILLANLVWSADPVRVCANGLPLYIYFQIQVIDTVYQKLLA